MQKSDFDTLAHHFMRNAVDVKQGDNTWVEYQGPQAGQLAMACAAKVEALGGLPYLIDTGHAAVNRLIGPKSASEISAYGVQQLERMKTMQGYIRLHDNDDQLKIDLPDEKKKLYKQALSPMNEHRVDHVRWLVVNAPTDEFARQCGMDRQEFDPVYMSVHLVDRDKMTEAGKPLESHLTATNKIRIYSPAQETDVTLYKRGIPAVLCTGQTNSPDGECFTAPEMHMVNGVIRFMPSKYFGEEFSFIKLTFRDGRVVKAEAENAERERKLNQMLDYDPGARRVGEYAESFHPDLTRGVREIGWDEKMTGAIHMAIGGCYKSAPNGNDSSIHWDMIQSHLPQYGGGEVWHDDVLVRKDGLYLPPELAGLNPDNLRASMGLARGRSPAATLLPRPAGTGQGSKSNFTV